MPHTDWSDELKNNNDVKLFEDGTGMHCKRCKTDLKGRPGRLFQSYTWTAHLDNSSHKRKAVSEAGKITSFFGVIDKNKRAKHDKGTKIEKNVQGFIQASMISICYL